MARPTRELTAHLAAALADRLVGRRLEKLWRPSARTLLFKVRGRTPLEAPHEDAVAPRVLVDLEQGHPRVVLSPRWPATPSAPDRHTIILRAHLEGARIEALSADERAIRWQLTGPSGPVELVLQLAGRYPNAALFDAAGAEIVRLIDGIPATDPDSPPLPRGADPWAELDDARFLLAFARVSEAEARTRRIAERGAALRRGLLTGRRRAERAVCALEADLARVDAAGLDRHRGELLKTVLGRVPRGASVVEVADWSAADGDTTAVPLDPQARPQGPRRWPGPGHGRGDSQRDGPRGS